MAKKVMYPTDGQHTIKWGMPAKLDSNDSREHDKAAEDYATKNLHNISQEEITRRYMISAGGAAASLGLGSFLLKSGAPRPFRAVMALPLGVAAGFYMSASEGRHFL
jgi:hypothetical protein